MDTRRRKLSLEHMAQRILMRTLTLLVARHDHAVSGDAYADGTSEFQHTVEGLDRYFHITCAASPSHVNAVHP
jgi:hypothetical protein